MCFYGIESIFSVEKKVKKKITLTTISSEPGSGPNIISPSSDQTLWYNHNFIQLPIIILSLPLQIKLPDRLYKG